MEPHHSLRPSTRTRRAPRAWLIALLGVGLPLLALLGAPAPATAQGGPRSLLFNTDNLPFGDGATTEPGARRARLIRLNAAAVVEGDSPLRQPAPAEFDLDSSRMELNLFNDTLITAALEKTVYRNGTNFIATGVVDGFAQSRVIIVAEGEVLAATIDVPGLGLYQIRYAGDGFHKIIEVDKAKVPNCGPLRKAPTKPKPIKVPKKITKPIVGSEPGPFVDITEPLLAGNIFAPTSDPGPMPPLEGDPATNTVIDIMVVYTPASRTGAGGVAAMNATIDLAMTEANEALANSLVPVTLNLVFRGEVPYTETGTASTDLTRLQSPSDGHMDAVHNWRNQYGADMVCLFTESMNTYAGLGYLMTSVTTNFSSYAFSVVRRVYATGTYTFAHELGHNLGCAHDRANSSSQGAYNYSYGHRFVGGDNLTYRTVMAYAPGTRIPYFSNPGVSYLGTPTGIAPGTNNSSANALSISNVAPTAAAFRTAVVIFSLTSVSNSVSETNGTFTMDVTRLSVTNLSASVDYTVSAGTATDGSDFVSTNGTLTFAAGETNKTITVPVLDDALRENAETFLISLINPTSGTLNISNSTIYINDDDLSYVGFSSTNLVVNEDTNTFTVEVIRTGKTNTAVTINYTTTNGTALAGSDYLLTNGILSFAAGETSRTFNVTVFNDSVNENRELFHLRLRSPTNTALIAGATNFAVTINTNDSADILFGAITNSVVEVDGTNTSSLSLTVVRTGTLFNEASVSFFTTNVTALASNDYTPTNGTITFAAGETNKTISLEILGDDQLELNETLRVVLHSASDARITRGTNTLTILDNDAATIGFTAVTNSLSETNTSITLNLTRTGVTNTEVSVNYFTTNVTAASGSDFTATNGTLVFAAGQTTNAITIALADDVTQEVNETFRVRLVSATNVAITAAASTNTVTLLDDDGSTVAFDVTALSVTEDTNNVTLTVVRSGTTNTEISVRFSTLTNSSARGGLDFMVTNGFLTFLPGVTTNTFAVRIINDLLAESNEVINVRLLSPTNTSLGASNLLLTITTNDAAYISFASATTSFSETNDTNAATITLTVNRTGTTNNTATVSFTTTNGLTSSASAGTDYLATNGTLTFAPGVISTQIFIPVLNDDLHESNKTFRVLLSGPVDATLTIATNVVTLADDDVSAVGFSTNAIVTSEESTNITFIVQRTGATNTAVAVNYTATNGTALAVSDYLAASGTLTFAPGVVSNGFTVDLVDDLNLEASETFRVLLSGVTNSALALGTNTITITNNDVASVSLEIATLSVAENTNLISLNVIRGGATNTTVSLRFLTLNGSALSGSDYAATNGILSFAPGVTTNTFAVRVIDDLLAENNETFTVRLANPTNTALGTSNLVVTILTNDSSIIAFSSATTNFTETTNASITLTVNRTGTTNNLATVNFATTNGLTSSATSGTDYMATNGTLTFAPGVITTQIVVAISNDDLQESNETFRVVLSGPADARLGIGTNVVTLADDDVSTTGFDTNATLVAEAGTNVTFTILRSGATNTAVAVEFTTTNLTATGASDYTVTNGTLYFAPGVTTNTVTVEVADDLTREINETFRLRLFAATNTTLALGTNTVTITDDDDATVTLLTNVISVAEDTNQITMTVVRTGMTNTSVSVRFLTTNGTALAGSDYAATNGILTFAPGVTTNTFIVRVLDDLLAENNETFSVRLANPTNTALGTSNLVVTITTNDSAVFSFASATTNFTETTNATISFTVNRTGTTNNLATVNFTTTNGVTASATAGTDYLATNGTLTFAAGVITTQIVVSILNDDLHESNETFRVLLTGPVDARVTIGTNLVTLADDDVSAVGFETNAVAAAENVTNLTFVVTRSGATNTAVAVDFRSTNLTASAGSDYGATNGTLYFAPGVVSNSFTVDITDDLTLEATEQFRVVLSGATNTALTTGTNLVTITDDDVAGVGFAVSSLSVTEDTNNVTIYVLRTGTTNTSCSVRFFTTNGTATAGTDFAATNGVLTYAPGVITNSFVVRVIDDGLTEGNETFNLRLSNPTNISLSTSNLVITITTNDSALIAFSSATTNFTETTNATITFTVNRTGTTNNLATVNFTTTNGLASSATAGSDYLSTNGTLTFAAGVITTQIVVSVLNDDLQESNKTFRVMLDGAVDARVTVGTNTVTLADDDVSTTGLDTNAVTAAEAGTNVTFTVVRSGATNTAVAVDFTTTNVTATGGTDYTATNGTLVFAPGVTTNTVTLAIASDDTQEANETFRFVLSGITNSTLGSAISTNTITDDDGSTVTLLTNVIAVAEDTNNVTMTVIRTGATNTAVTVNFATTNGTALAGTDYAATNGILSFAPGVTTNTFAVRVINDLVAENNESFTIRLLNATNTSLGTASLTLTITTNDSAIFSFASATTNFTETTNATITFTVNRTGTTNHLATVDFTTTNVTALADGDYLATNGTLTFAAGVITTQVVVSILNDDLQESNETFRVVLTNPVDATIGTGTNTVTLADDDVSTTGLDTNAVTVAEAGTNVTFTIVRSGATNTAVAVEFTTTNVTATGGTDYTATNGTLVFAPGVTTNTVTLAITSDDAQEANETFRFVLSGITNSTLGTAISTNTITDDDGSTVTLLTNAISVAEDTNSITITVIRTSATNTAVTANFLTVNGTASAGSDYYATNGILSFAPGVTTNTFTVRVIDDLVAENNETVFVRLASGTNTSLGVTNLTLTITTNDSAIFSFASATTNFTETTNATITFTVNRTGTTNHLATVDFTTTNLTALADGDYLATNGTLTFAAGVLTTQVVVSILNDDLQESNETFRVVLSNPIDATIGIGTNTVTIADDDVSTVGLDTNAVAVAETGTNVTFTVVRSGATNTAVAVDFTTTNGVTLSATAGTDYTATNGTLSFAPGVTTNTITLAVADDALQEGNETFRLILSGLTNSTLAFGTNVATITDDDASSVSYWTNALTVFENTNVITIYVLRSGATNTAVTVNFTNLASSTATVGSDFTATNGTLSFAPGVTTNTFTLTIIDDGTAENSELVNYRLQNPTNTSLGTSNLVVTITTNDSAIISLATSTTSFTETNDTNATITLTVNRTGTTFNQCTVNFTTTNASATAGSDYTATNGTLTFAAGVSTTQIVVSILFDDLQETNETFRVVLSSPVDATIGTGSNVVTIIDDDVSSLDLTTNAVTVAETGTNVTFTIVRSGATNTAVAVDFTTTNVTATAGNDYTATNNTLYFAPGVTTNTVTVNIADDLLYEGNETFRLLLSGVTNSATGIATNTATITDDDLSTLTFETDTDSVSELDGTIDILVSRTGVTNTVISVAYHTTNLTATAGSDYIATNGVLSFAAGETQKTITVAIVFDGPVESGETFRVRLVSFTNTAAGAETNLTVTINDAFGDGGGFAPASTEPVAISAINAVGANDLRLHITGPAGAPFVIETTTDFQTWTPVSTNYVRTTGTDWLTPIDRTVPARYFRVVRPQ